MTRPLEIAVALLAGTALGGVFFGGLWLTIRRALDSPTAPLWFGLSFIGRTAVAVGGFYVVGVASLPRLLACLVGFLVARIAMTRLLRSTSTGSQP